MNKKILTIIEIILLLILIKLFLTFLLNGIFIAKYNKEKYDINDLKVLSLINFPESYIYHYNQGNVLYQNGKYDEAIEEYYKSLEKHPPEKKECAIRINLTLAKLKTLKSETEENKKKNIEILKQARKILCENGCANEEDSNGHSKKAQELKEDIDKKLKQLEEDKEENSSDEKNKEEQEKEEKSKENNKTKEAEEKLMKIQEQTIGERQKELEDNEMLWSDDYSYIYYDGKTW
ncbi:MAG: hypothetical protein HFJ44_03165 [Clostridia bacterium]|nr:hypothetical protein [Clostridia bacterium]